MITQTSALAFTLARNRLKPLSVRELFAARTRPMIWSAFVRRGARRYWSDNIDVPLDETARPTSWTCSPAPRDHRRLAGGQGGRLLAMAAAGRPDLYRRRRRQDATE